jgi:pimeloyl-ACP methyl ester carboxylesterase
LRFLYLHGFASGVDSGKARFLRGRFAELGLNLEVPDLAQGDFENLTISGQLRVIDRHLNSDSACLIGSSLGGYLTALYASSHPEIERVVLLAPAFGFARRWPDKLGTAATAQWERTGYMDVFHYGENAQRRISWKIIQDGRNYPDEPSFSQPALIFHGIRDDVVPSEFSRSFAANRPNVTLRLLDSDHQLTDSVDLIWAETKQFLLR